jgi:hypothetical protein
MALVLPNQGEQIALEALVGKTAGINLILRLFKSNTTPAESDTEATYTEANFTGYSAITLTAASWSFAGGNPSTLSYAQQVFTSSADAQNQPIYGYYLTQVGTGKLVWAERKLDGAGQPFTITNNGDAYKVTPVITLE